MLLYEFACQQCRVVFEELVAIGSMGEGLQCPDCGRAGNAGSYQSIGGQGCACGGNCGSCGGNCSCHH